jgi:hypothetical protein
MWQRRKGGLFAAAQPAKTRLQANGVRLVKIACVAVVKDEERYIAEWIAYQLALGFDTILLLDNNSGDQTKAIAAGFAPRHDVRLFDWPMRTPDYQLRAYEFAARRFAGEFAWMAFFDTDEFLVLDEGASLKQRLAGLPDAAAVGISWAMFGSSHHRDSPAGLVIENYLHRSGADFGPNIHVKSIIRPALMRATSNPHAFEMDGTYVDLAGRTLRWESLGKIAGPPDYAGGKLHHYFTRSRSDWLAKLRRGYRDMQRTEAVFYAYDRNEIFDEGAAKLTPLVRAILSGIAAPKYRFALAACARWETPYITEWLNYHRAIGFEHVFLYCNDDDPDEFYAEVLPFTEGVAPFVTFNHHPGQGEQQQMYRHFLLHYPHQCEWVGFLDIDEFLRLPPEKKIAGFIGGFGPDVDCVLFNWIFFGPNGHKTPPAGSVLASYTRRSESIHPYTKYLVKSSVLTGSKILDPVAGHGFWHSLHDMLPAPIRVVNVLGEDAGDYYEGFPDRPSSIINQWDMKSRLLSTAIIHHYAFRSEQAFWDRSARGLEGAFRLQTIWRELAEGDGFAAFLESVNATEDLRLAEFWQAHVQQGWHRRAAALQLPPATSHNVKLGIAITTLNRCDMVLNLVAKIREFTEMDYELVICDDGSTDATKSALLASGQVFIGGTQRGIAWNKNRGIFFLLNVLKCDVILLLDDDIVPTIAGWEAEWVEAASRYGHVNYALPSIRDKIKSGASTVADPGLSADIPGCAMAFSRTVLAQIGYFDTRFGRYGNEHTDFSFRAIRAGFGGVTVQEDDWKATYFYVIEGGIELLPSVSSRTQEDVDATGRMLHEFFHEPIYRHAWAADEMRDVFLGEIEAALGASDSPLRLKNHFLSWRDYLSAKGLPEAAPPADGRKNLALRKPATQISVDQWSAGRSPQEDAAGAVNGRVDGRRKFHTALEDNPWWQVDLGGFETIHEIRIYNTTEDTAFRFKNFSLSVSIEGEFWIEIARKEDNAVVGGIIGGPYVWNGPGTAWARFVRITLLGRDYLHLDQVEVYGSPAEPPATAGAAAAAPAAAVLPARIASAKPFSKIPNPLGGQGFVLGWEAALLGNRLSSFANIFALTERTGIPAGYAQILDSANLFEVPERRFYSHGNLSPEQFRALDGLAPFVEDLFSKSYEDYNRRFMTVSLPKLHELNTESGIIVFAQYQPGFQDLAAVEDGLKTFCGRGNGVILPGAYWHQYLDMRTLRPTGEALKQKLRINRDDRVTSRASSMRDAGTETLLIGVHIRQGDDYRGWIGGKYYFSAAQYTAVMRRIHTDLAGRPHYFCVCSDALIDTAELQGLPVWYERGAPEDDFVALSKCDYVVGPPSTFGTWSAFLGGAKRAVLTPERMAHLATLPPLLDTAVEIIYPTGGYLPGDPTAGPI